MGPITILIQKTRMSGAQALFAPAVRPGAEVYFSSGVDGFEVVIPNMFDSSSFALSSSPTSKTIPLTASCGVYVFYIVSEGSKDPIAYLQLTVENDGIDKVGFYVADDSLIHTQLSALAGPVTICYKKQVVNEEASLSVWHGSERVSSTTIQVGATVALTQPLKLEDKLSIQLDSSPQPSKETGGTRVIDIIAEPPPEPPAKRPKRSLARPSQV